MSFLQFSEIVLDWALTIALVLLCLSLTLTVVRIWKGPTLPDRVLGLDVLTSSSIGLIAVIGIDTGFTLYVDIAIALGLVGFLATVSFARFIMARGDTERSPVAGGTVPVADAPLPKEDRPVLETEHAP